MSKIEPGDLCVIVYVNCDALKDALGKHVTVVAPVTMRSGKPGWTFDRDCKITLLAPGVDGAGARFESGQTVLFDTAPESWLQPIRGLPAARPSFEFIGDEVVQ